MPTFLFLFLLILTSFATSQGFPAGSVTGFSLVDAETGRPVAGHDPLTSGATLDLAQLADTELTVVASTDPGTVGSVRFALNDALDYHTEELAPYALTSSQGGRFAAWTPEPGAYNLTATPYSDPGAGGNVGTSLTIAFTVIDSAAVPAAQQDSTSQAGTAQQSAPPSEAAEPEGLRVSAGDDRAVSVSDTVTLEGQIAGHDGASALELSWSLVDGPGAVLFTNSSAATTSADFIAPGAYVLELTARSGEDTASSQVTLTVQDDFAGFRVPDPETGTLPLRGNPRFSESQLPAEARVWYRRMWAFINNPDQRPNFKAQASSGNLHHYGKSLNNYHTQLLAVFRLTGDLRILDEIADNAERMLGALADTTGDGYLNWTFRGTNDSRGALDEVMTHSHVAALAYAFHLNRNLFSPSRVEYGRLSDKLLDYLLDHFESKWRERNARAIASQGQPFPFLRATLNHPYVNWIRYHYYLYLLTGEEGYLTYLQTMRTTAQQEFKESATSSGSALLWDYRFTSDPFNFVGEEDRHGLTPTLYAKYTYAAALDLYLEGVEPFDHNFMQKMATTLSHFILDGACLSACGARDTFQLDIGATHHQRTDDGTLLRTGYAQERRFTPPTYNHYGDWPFAAYAAFERSDNKIHRMNLAAFNAIENGNLERPRRPHIPIGIVFTALYALGHDELINLND